MKSNVCRVLVLVALLVPLSGCPAPPLTTGLWLFTIFAQNGDFATAALYLLDGGQTQIPSPMPPEATAGFSANLIWAQNGSTFTLTNPLPVSANYTGTVYTSTTMRGTWMVTGDVIGSGNWRAELLP